MYFDGDLEMIDGVVYVWWLGAFFPQHTLFLPRDYYVYDEYVE